jgi:hypothetical protein
VAGQQESVVSEGLESKKSLSPGYQAGSSELAGILETEVPKAGVQGEDYEEYGSGEEDYKELQCAWPSDEEENVSEDEQKGGEMFTEEDSVLVG